MWAINRKTGIKFEMSEEYYEKWYSGNADIEKLADKPEKKTIKQLKIEAKQAGITGSDRMSKEEIESLLSEA